MKVIKTTPDGTFTVTIESVFTDPEQDAPEVSRQQLVQLLEHTAGLFRAPVKTSERDRLARPVLVRAPAARRAVESKGAVSELLELLFGRSTRSR